MAKASSQFLDLPLEIHLEVFAHLHLHDKLATKGRPARQLHPAILAVNQQIHADAFLILYSKNMFITHGTLLTSFPRLQLWYPPVKERLVLPRIRWFHIRVRLDCNPGYDAAAVTAVFTGIDELVIEVWQSMFLGSNHDALSLFECVCNVKAVKIYGSATSFKGYAGWLEDVMCSKAG